MTDQIARHLRTEELYDLIVERITYSEDPTVGFHSSTQVRRVLDQIITQGKIEGRLTALSSNIPHGSLAEDDRLIGVWQKIVDQRPRDPRIPEWRRELMELLRLSGHTPEQKRRIAELHEGIGDDFRAYAWWKKAAEAGDRDAADMVKLLDERRPE